MVCALEGTSVKGTIERLSPSEGEEVVDEHRVRRLLADLGLSTDLSLGVGNIEEVEADVDQLLPLLPRIRDIGLLARARTTLETVDKYLAGIPREGGGVLADE